jgi:uncharacterized repeat protein (TIGR01451 family)
MNTIKGMVWGIVAAVVAALSFGSAMAANPASATTATGQSLSIQIDAPVDGASVPEGSFNVSGRASIGGGTSLGPAAISYVVDVSASTASPNGMDCSGDGIVDDGDQFNAGSTVGDTLDCELSGLFALNESLLGSADISVSLISFESKAKQRDVDPAVEGTQPFTEPDADTDGNGLNDIRQVGRSLTAKGGTNFDAAIAVMNASFEDRPAGERHVAYFLSDGIPQKFKTGSDSALAKAARAGTVIHTYSVGGNSTGCGTNAALGIIAAATGGTCTEVQNPAELVHMLGQPPAGIRDVAVAVDDGPSVPATLDALGNFTAAATVNGYGNHSVSATVTATDAVLTSATAQVGIVVPDPHADLSIVKTATASTVLLNENITYHLTISNAGPATATGVTVNDPLPAAVSYVSASPTQGTCSFAAPNLSCSLGTIAPGALATVTLVVRADVVGPVSNSATVAGEQPDPSANNSSSTVTVTVERRPSALTAEPAILSALSDSLLDLNLRFEARLHDGTQPLPGRPLVFTAGSRSCIGTTDLSGTAVCSLTIPRLLASVLRFGYDVDFAGDATYLSSSGHGPVVQLLSIPVF